MRHSIRGWRSARAGHGNALAPAASSFGAPAMNAAFAPVVQEPMRFGLGILALAFYLWLVHSYKLAAGDVAVAALGVGVLLRGGSLRFPAPLMFFLLFIVWNAMGLVVTEDTTVTREAVINLGKLWIISFCVINVIRNAAELRFILIAWLALYALYPVRGAFYNQYICNCTEFGRVAWNFVFANPNDLAALSLIPLSIAAGVATVERTKFFRLSALAGVVVLALLVLLTQSRGALLALGISALFLPLASRRKGRDIVLLVAMFGIAAIFAPKDVWTRIAGLSNVSIENDMQGVDPEGSAAARWQIWGVAARTARDNPLLGVGAGMMPITHRWESSRLNLNWSARGERDTHSTYLRIAAESGFPGMVLYIMIWGAVFMRVHQARRTVRHVRRGDYQLLFYLELGMLAFMLASLFGTFSALAFTYLSLSVAWVTATILEREPWYRSRFAGVEPAPAPARAVMRRRR